MPPVSWAFRLLDPGTAEAAQPSQEEIATVVGSEPEGRERLDLYTRAILLDWVIDPLADYLDADQAPQHARRVRAQERQEHLGALARYQARYP